MKKHCFFLLSSILALAACSKEIPVVTEPEPNGPNPDGSYNIEVVCEDIVSTDGTVMSAATKSEIGDFAYSALYNADVYIYADGILISDYHFNWDDGKPKNMAVTFPTGDAYLDVFVLGNCNNDNVEFTVPRTVSEMRTKKLTFNGYLKFKDAHYGFPMAKHISGFKPGTSKISVARLVSFYTLSVYRPSGNPVNTLDLQIHSIKMNHAAKEVTPFNTESDRSDCNEFVDDADAVTQDDIATLEKGGEVVIYFIENKRGVNADINTPEEKTEDNVPDGSKGKCTYLTFDYTVDGDRQYDDEGKPGKIFYLGVNSTTDFNLNRNMNSNLMLNVDTIIKELYLLSGTSHNLRVPTGIISYRIEPVGDRAHTLVDRISASALDTMVDKLDDCTLVVTNKISPKTGTSRPPLYSDGTISNDTDKETSKSLIRSANLDFSFNIIITTNDKDHNPVEKVVSVWPIVGRVNISLDSYAKGTAYNIGDINQSTPFLVQSGINVEYASAEYDGVKIYRSYRPQKYQKGIPISIGVGDVIGLGNVFKRIVRENLPASGWFIDQYKTYDSSKAKPYYSLTDDELENYYEPYWIHAHFAPFKFANEYFMSHSSNNSFIDSRDILAVPDKDRTSVPQVKYTFEASFTNSELAIFENTYHHNHNDFPAAWLNHGIMVSWETSRGEYLPTLY